MYIETSGKRHFPVFIPVQREQTEPREDKLSTAAGEAHGWSLAVERQGIRCGNAIYNVTAIKQSSSYAVFLS